MHAWCAGRSKIVASDTTQPKPSQTFQTRNDFIPNPDPNEPPIATQASTDALPAQPRTALHRGRRSTQEQAASLRQAAGPGNAKKSKAHQTHYRTAFPQPRGIPPSMLEQDADRFAV